MGLLNGNSVRISESPTPSSDLIKFFSPSMKVVIPRPSRSSLRILLCAMVVQVEQGARRRWRMQGLEQTTSASPAPASPASLPQPLSVLRLRGDQERPQAEETRQ